MIYICDKKKVNVPQEIKIANIQLKTKLSQEVIPQLDCEHVKKVLSYVESALEEKCNWIVLPELSTNNVIVNNICSLIEQYQHPVGIICGSYYHEDSEGKRYNQSCILLKLGNKCEEPIYQKKMAPSYTEKDKIALGKERNVIVNTGIGDIAVFICYDVNDWTIFPYMEGLVDILFVIAYNPSNGQFFHYFERGCYQHYYTIVYSNDALYGNSCFFFPEKNNGERCKNKIPKNTERMSIFKFSINQMDKARTKRHPIRTEEFHFSYPPRNISGRRYEPDKRTMDYFTEVIQKKQNFFLPVGVRARIVLLLLSSDQEYVTIFLPIITKEFCIGNSTNDQLGFLCNTNAIAPILISYRNSSFVLEYNDQVSINGQPIYSSQNLANNDVIYIKSDTNKIRFLFQLPLPINEQIGGNVYSASSIKSKLGIEGIISEDRYELQEKIYQGKENTIYRALQKNTGKEVAIKIGNVDLEIIKRFVNLKNPKIIQTHDFFPPSGIVMDYFEGHNLSHALESEKNIGVMLNWIIDASSAVCYLNDMGFSLKIDFFDVLVNDEEAKIIPFKAEYMSSPLIENEVKSNINSLQNLLAFSCLKFVSNSSISEHKTQYKNLNNLFPNDTKEVDFQTVANFKKLLKGSYNEILIITNVVKEACENKEDFKVTLCVSSCSLGETELTICSDIECHVSIVNESNGELSWVGEYHIDKNHSIPGYFELEGEQKFYVTAYTKGKRFDLTKGITRHFTTKLEYLKEESVSSGVFNFLVG